VSAYLQKIVDGCFIDVKSAFEPAPFRRKAAGVAAGNGREDTMFHRGRSPAGRAPTLGCCESSDGQRATAAFGIGMAPMFVPYAIATAPIWRGVAYLRQICRAHVARGRAFEAMATQLYESNGGSA